MRTLIVYSSVYGTTEKCALELKEKLSGEVELFRLVKKKTPELSGYDRIIFGCPVYMGKLTKEGERFLELCEGELLEREFALFLTCSNVGKKTFQHNLDYNFSFELLEHAKAKGCFGGELELEKLHFMHRMLTKMIRAQQAEVPDPKILHERIGYFAEVLEGVREAGTENPPLPKPEPVHTDEASNSSEGENGEEDSADRSE